MSEDDVEGLRKEIGQKMALDGEPLHENASESVRNSYRRASVGWGSNVMPRNFGRTGEPPKDWYCVCGHLNKGTQRKMKGKRQVCWQCEVDREYGEDHG
jgi:hypothetical protein